VLGQQAIRLYRRLNLASLNSTILENKLCASKTRFYLPNYAKIIADDSQNTPYLGRI
jgi:hypothetical protein